MNVIVSFNTVFQITFRRTIEFDQDPARVSFLNYDFIRRFTDTIMRLFQSWLDRLDKRVDVTALVFVYSFNLLADTGWFLTDSATDSEFTEIIDAVSGEA